ncbi:hypothetical protein FMN50_15130 [Rhodobacterales bacterium]|nr:hypothetical protein FMN50_15130 [Rhodobacterales bacterium]
MFLLVLFAIPRKSPLIVVEAETELLSYVVMRPELAAIPFNNVRLRGGKLENCTGLAASGDLFTGIVQPTAGVQVWYRFVDGNPLIELRAGNRKTDDTGHLQFENGTRCAIQSRLVIRLANTTNSDSVNARPLPIAGPARLGTELSAPLINESSRRMSGLLLSGSLRILGRASDPSAADALYPAIDEEIVIPAGSRLSSFTDNGQELQEPSSWYGIATIGDGSYSVAATTESDFLRLYRPGQSQDAESFRTSLFAQVFNDPSLATMSLALVVLSIVFQTLLAWLGLPSRIENGPSRKAPAVDTGTADTGVQSTLFAPGHPAVRDPSDTPLTEDRTSRSDGEIPGKQKD